MKRSKGATNPDKDPSRAGFPIQEPRPFEENNLILKETCSKSRDLAFCRCILLCKMPPQASPVGVHTLYPPPRQTCMRGNLLSFVKKKEEKIGIWSPGGSLVLAGPMHLENDIEGSSRGGDRGTNFAAPLVTHDLGGPPRGRRQGGLGGCRAACRQHGPALGVARADQLQTNRSP